MVKSTKARSRTGGRTPARKGQALPDDACTSCGTTMLPRRGPWTVRVNGEPIVVPSVPRLRCPKCLDVMFHSRDMQRAEEDAIGLYRRRLGLLSADEIRALRARFALTQAELARLLRLGGNTVSRWESGRNVQSAAMDMLLRMMRDLPGSLAYLRAHAA